MVGLVAGGTPGNYDKEGDGADDKSDEDVCPVVVRILLRVISLHASPPLAVGSPVMIAHRKDPSGKHIDCLY